MYKVVIDRKSFFLNVTAHYFFSSFMTAMKEYQFITFEKQ